MSHHDNGNDRLGTYYTPDAHTEIAIDGAIDAEEHRIDRMSGAIADGLAACTVQQRDVWRLASGIRDDGTVTEPISFPQVAALLGLKSKSTVEMHYLRADNAILKALLKQALQVAAAVPTDTMSSIELGEEDLDETPPTRRVPRDVPPVATTDTGHRPRQPRGVDRRRGAAGTGNESVPTAEVRIRTQHAGQRTNQLPLPL